MDSETASCATVDGTLINALRARLQADTEQPVALVETHISWVLLTERLAYKLKKPVRLPFVDFSALTSRKHFCEEEVRLNRRLAPSLYLGVVPVYGTMQAPRIGVIGVIEDIGEPIDYVVCMLRFAPGALLSERLAAGGLLPGHLDRLAQRLADFHRDAPAALPASPLDAEDQVLQPVLKVLKQLQADGDTSHIAALRAWVDAQVPALREAWRARRGGGAVRECHGDLHLANAVLIGDEATAFDCIEFDPALRWIDVMSDVAFLAMDLTAHGRSDLAFSFLDTYLQRSGDYSGVRVLRFYEVYRALVRALVGHVRSRSAGAASLAAGPDYLACAQRLAHTAGGMARLLITHGLSGSGKSTVARQLLAAAGAIRLRSDVERKRLFGLGALQRSAEQAVDIYTPGATRRTFDRLKECARTALQAGYPVIVDAAFLQRAERRAFHALAVDLRVPFSILHCRASETQLRQRVAARNVVGHDASEANVKVLEHQLASHEPLDGDERAVALEVVTDEPVEVAALCARWLSQL
ncbi:MAG TPA: aminoglycoside phosphotransferase [Polaromonas sp.]|uniref:bifunctional aminoglycoside phosphotransferase/ATP-binding protein n=1 Tax=Polaromonas sp. UBA4122 TaxID=1947074 RepID=UPI000EF03EBD|nr:bifunctional aminoglycoside phosphotransferase/ATP-binding protein [Polaromonas sp. UBA4122]HAL36911.1 aminoglycoside phosphotransferase [Polaromonas sp.]